MAVGVNKTYTYGESIEPSYNITGYVNGDDQNVVTGTIAYTYEKNGAAYSAAKFTVGNYTVNADGLKVANYNIEYVSADFTVNKKALTVNTTVAESFVYGTAVNAGVTYEGFIDGENAGNALDGKLIFSYTKDNAPYTEDKFVVGNYTVTADGYEAENYQITYKSADFTVTKKALNVSITGVQQSYVFGAEVNPATTVSGFAYNETVDVLGGELEISISGAEKVAGLLPVGEYTVTTGGYTSENYQITYGTAQFSVTARDITLKIDDTSKSGTIWTNSVTKEELGLADTDYVVAGVLKLNKTEKDTYTVTGAELSADFEWAEDFAITLGGTDITKNFNLTYKIEVRLENSAFASHARGINSTYNGTAQQLGTVTVDDEIVYTLEYRLGDSGEWVKEMPTATDAGSYTVYYRISAENYETYENYFTATIGKAANNITYTQHNAETYNGEEHEFALDAAHFATTDGSAVQLVEGQTNKFTTAGQHTFNVYVPESKNYLASEPYTVTVTINKAQFEIEYTDYGTLTYDGAEHDFSLTNFSVPYGAPVKFAEGSDTKWQNADVYNVNVIVEEGENWEGASRKVTVTVNQAANKITEIAPYDAVTYSGTPFTFADFDRHFSADFGEVVLKEGSTNKFTNANTYKFTVCVIGNSNYAGAELEVSVTINKAEYKDSDVPSQRLEDDHVLLGVGKTVKDVALTEVFYWSEEVKESTYVEGSNIFAAFYCADPENYYPKEVEITFTAYKENISIAISGSTGVNFGSTLENVDFFADTVNFAITREDMSENASLSSMGDMLTASVPEGAFNTGSTYAITYAAKQNPYYSVTVTANNAVLKVKSVLIKQADVSIDKETYFTVEEAISQTDSGDTIIIANNTSFAVGEAQKFYYSNGAPDSKYYTLLEGVTLLVPYENTNYSADFNSTATVTAVAATGKFLLILPDGIDLAVFGNIIVNALVTQTTPYSSVVNGANYGAIDIQAGATITLNGSATLENRGFIYGEGNLIANSETQVYELFNLIGYRGGTASSLIFNVFPLNQYALTGIIVKTEIKTGGIYGARAYITALGGGIDASVVFVSKEDSSFMTLSSGSVFKWIDESTGKIHFDLQGTVSFHNMSIDIGGLSTKNKEIPIPGNFAISVTGEGSVTTVPSDIRMKFLPGATLTVGSGATLNIEGRLYIYSVNEGNSVSVSIGQWKDGTLAYPVNNSGTAQGAYRTGNKLTLGYDVNTPAQFIVKGILNIKSGATIGGKISGTLNGRISIDQNVSFKDTIEEYKETKLSIIAQYFDSTFTAMGIIDGTLSDFAAGNYTYGENGWAVSA